MRRSLSILAIVLSPGLATAQFAPPPPVGGTAPPAGAQTAPTVDIEAFAAQLTALETRRDALIERERIAIEAPVATDASLAERDRLREEVEQADAALAIELWAAEALEGARARLAGNPPGTPVTMLPPEALSRPLPAQMRSTAFLLDGPNGTPDSERQVAAQEIVIRLGLTSTGSQALIWSLEHGFGYVRTETLGVYADD